MIVRVNNLDKQQAIYAEIENEPPDKKVREYFKSVPYHLKKRKEVEHGKDRYIHKKQG